MDELIAWLRAQLDEDSVYAKETSVVTRPPTPEINRPESVGSFDYVVMPDSEGGEGIEPADAEHIARWDPARVLAEVEAKRRVIDVLRGYEPSDEWDTQPDMGQRANNAAGALRALAQPYAGREGWRAEWSA